MLTVVDHHYVTRPFTQHVEPPEHVIPLKSRYVLVPRTEKQPILTVYRIDGDVFSLTAFLSLQATLSIASKHTCPKMLVQKCCKFPSMNCKSESHRSKCFQGICLEQQYSSSRSQIINTSICPKVHQ